MKPEFNNFFNHYTNALEEGQAAVFAGAGLSFPAGYADWKSLLRDVATELGLDVDQESDLVAVAQFHVNSQSSDRSRINRLLINEFTKDATLTENHKLIAGLPLRTVWTTNYDELLEQAFREAGKRPDVKTTQENLAQTPPRSDVTIYKMHGDIRQPQDAVLTKEDYESYNEYRQLFSTSLQGDLISKTFLFLGFSFTDANIDYILSRIRVLLGRNKREHYCIMKRPQKPAGRGKALAKYEYEATKIRLRMDDLKRYSIQALLIDDYKEVTGILQELHRRSHRKNIFVSGSAAEFDHMDRARVEGLAYKIGEKIIESGNNLVSGFGLGIGSAVVVGAIEKVYADDKSRLEDRVVLRPFPKKPVGGMLTELFSTKYREDMIGQSRFTIYLCGNKLNPTTNKVELAQGVQEEFDIAVRFGKYPIPVGATGYLARELWEDVRANLKRYFPDESAAKYFDILGDSSKSDDALVSAIFDIVKQYTNK